MFKKKIDTLLKEELATLLENNTDLCEKLQDYAIENAAFWLDEYLASMPRGAADYSISYGGAWDDYFTIKDVDKFLEWAEKVNSDFGLFFCEREIIAELDKMNDLYKHCFELWCYGHSDYTGKYGSIKEEDFYNVEKKFIELGDEAAEMTLNRLRAELDYFTDYRTGEKLREYLVALWYDFADSVFDDTSELFTDEHLTNIYEYEPSYFIPAHVVPESKNLII